MSAPTRGNWFTRGGWWFFVHVLSLGILAVVPFTAAAAVSRRVGHVLLAVAVAVLTIAWIALGPAGVGGAAGNAAGMITFFGLFLGGIAALGVLRQQIYGSRAPAPSSGPDPAISRALAGRRRRTEARRLATEDPLLARELRIGRPDLPRDYDDGGLVDLNSAPAPAIADLCGLDPGQAGRVVQARQAAGRFASVEDVFSWTELPVDVWDRVRDRAVTL